MMQAKRYTRLLPALMAAFLLSSCSILPEPNRYTLYRLPPSSMDQQAVAIEATSLTVEAPRANAITSSNRMVVLRSGQNLSTWSGVRWTSPAPELLRDQLLDAFHHSGAFRTLGIRDDGLDAARTLTGHLRAFHVDQTGDAPTAMIQMDARLMDRHGNTIAPMKRFEITEPLAANTPTAATDAMGQATDRLARQLLDWMAEQPSD